MKLNLSLTLLQKVYDLLTAKSHNTVAVHVGTDGLSGEPVPKVLGTYYLCAHALVSLLSELRYNRLASSKDRRQKYRQLLKCESFMLESRRSSTHSSQVRVKVLFETLFCSLAFPTKLPYYCEQVTSKGF